MNGFPTNPQQFGYDGQPAITMSTRVPDIDKQLELFIKYELLNGLDGWATFNKTYDDRLLYRIENYIISEERVKRYITNIHSIKMEDFALRLQ